MKEAIKFIDEMLFALLLWPVIIWGIFNLLIDVLHMPHNWYTFFLTMILSIYFAIKVESKK